MELSAATREAPDLLARIAENVLMLVRLPNSSAEGIE